MVGLQLGSRFHRLGLTTAVNLLVLKVKTTPDSDVIGGLVQSLLGSESSCFWRNLDNDYLCWDFCFAEC